MRYTLRYISDEKFYYPLNVGAYHDNADTGSYMVLHLTDRLSEAAMWDTEEQAIEVSEIEFDLFDPTYLLAELLGVMRVTEKQLFEIRLKDR